MDIRPQELRIVDLENKVDQLSAENETLLECVQTQQKSIQSMHNTICEMANKLKILWNM